MTTLIEYGVIVIRAPTIPTAELSALFFIGKVNSNDRHGNERHQHQLHVHATDDHGANCHLIDNCRTFTWPTWWLSPIIRDWDTPDEDEAWQHLNEVKPKE